MALKNVKEIDDKLTKMYENQITTPPVAATEYVDRSEILLSQMNFIALNNKSFLNLR